ncbi:hypothetical protein [Thiosocius teredinicola]|uniref:hypothetical protein n=1 Tax=Thiosocius teredinicola TaxID=1973002 RepID=UPI000990BC77
MRFTLLLMLAVGITMVWQSNAIAFGMNACATDRAVWADDNKNDKGKDGKAGGSGEEEPDCE